MTFYCTADGAGPRDCPDWSTLSDEARLAEPGHVARNGNPPRSLDLPRVDLTFVDLGDSVDEFGGRLASVNGVQLRCPECLAPVRAVESDPTP